MELQNQLKALSENVTKLKEQIETEEEEIYQHERKRALFATINYYEE